MAIFKGNGFVADDWRSLAPGEQPAPGGKFLMTVPQWQAIGEQIASGRTLGLLIEPAQDLHALAAELSRFALIAVLFPKFTDGRGYSIAHKLRSRFGFAGELRATGEILFDQLQLLARAGFDSFEITDAATLRLLESGRRPHLGLFYQPGLGQEIPEHTRAWARRSLS